MANGLVAGHGAIVKAVGDQGGAGTALGSMLHYCRVSLLLDYGAKQIQSMQLPLVTDPEEILSSRTQPVSKMQQLMPVERLLQLGIMIQPPKSHRC